MVLAKLSKISFSKISIKLSHMSSKFVSEASQLSANVFVLGDEVSRGGVPVAG